MSGDDAREKGKGFRIDAVATTDGRFFVRDAATGRLVEVSEDEYRRDCERREKARRPN